MIAWNKLICYPSMTIRTLNNNNNKNASSKLRSCQVQWFVSHDRSEFCTIRIWLHRIDAFIYIFWWQNRILWCGLYVWFMCALAKLTFNHFYWKKKWLCLCESNQYESAADRTKQHSEQHEDHHCCFWFCCDCALKLHNMKLVASHAMRLMHY